MSKCNCVAGPWQTGEPPRNGETCIVAWADESGSAFDLGQYRRTEKVGWIWIIRGIVCAKECAPNKWALINEEK